MRTPVSWPTPKKEIKRTVARRANTSLLDHAKKRDQADTAVCSHSSLASWYSPAARERDRVRKQLLKREILPGCDDGGELSPKRANAGKGRRRRGILLSPPLAFGGSHRRPGGRTGRDMLRKRMQLLGRLTRALHVAACFCVRQLSCHPPLLAVRSGTKRPHGCMEIGRTLDW